jgi:Tfp pilus assembly protein PilF
MRPTRKPGERPSKPIRKPADKDPVRKPADAKPQPAGPRPSEVAALHYKKGNDYIRQKNFPEAIKSFQAALKADKSLALAHRGLGIAYAQLRQNKKACQEYRIYLKMIPASSKEVPTLKKILEGC